MGDFESRRATVEQWSEPNREGVDDASRPRGLLFWNVWDKVDAGGS